MSDTTMLAPPRIRAPFTPEQVDALNRHQTDDRLHAYTCDNWHGDPAERRNLVATVRGWICRFCDYKQDWAHGGHETRLSCAQLGVECRHHFSCDSADTCVLQNPEMKIR